MPKIATAAIIVLCLATASGCWFIYRIEHQRDVRESREIEARDLASRELETYQAWHHATRYETFKGALTARLKEEARTRSVEFTGNRESRKGSNNARITADEIWDAMVWVKSFQRSDVKFAGKSPKYGNASYQVSSVIIWRTHELELRYIAAQSTLEKMDAPGDWITSGWTFGPIEVSPDGAYHGESPAELVKRSE